MGIPYSTGKEKHHLYREIVGGECDKMFVDCLSLKRGVLVLQNSLPYRVEQSISTISQLKWTSHFINYTDFGHTLRHDNSTKWYENRQTLSWWFQIVAVCRILKNIIKILAFRQRGEFIWAHNISDPPQYQDPLIHNHTTFKCPIAFYSITTSCHIPPSILCSIHLFFNAWCLIIWLSEHRIIRFRLVLNTHWSITD